MRNNSIHNMRTPSLRRLKTAFTTNTNTNTNTGLSPTSPTSSTMSPSSSRSPSVSRSPQHRNMFNRTPSSSVSSVSSLRALLLLRRKPSTIEFEMEEERRSFSVELGMLEPRPVAWGREPSLPGMGGVDCVPVPGIFEVLDGRV